ncbi:MAG: exodeoxyribonuclease VII small subunit [Bacteroidales bacterium]|nr:exodeoxyribonuclease VII small subunit [Bacteroidales bacterium]MBP5373472.1 exodeoxyribonuclease VII small subunit [Bacteroidales bacterium]
MEAEFDYAKAIAQLEEIAAKVENPETSLEDIDALVSRSKVLIAGCRDYLRSVKEKIDSLDQQL